MGRVATVAALVMAFVACGGGKKKKNAAPVLSFESDPAWKKDPGAVLTRELRALLPGYAVTIGAVKLGDGYGAFAAENVELRRMASGPNWVMRFDSLAIRASGTSTLEVSVEGKILDATVRATMTRSATMLTVKSTIKELPIGDPKGWQLAAAGVPIRGTVGLTVDLSLPESKWVEANGTIDFRCDACATAAGKVGMPGKRASKRAAAFMGGGLTLPAIKLGNLSAVLIVRKGDTTVQIEGTGDPDLEITGAGSVRFAEPVRRSAVDICMRLQLTGNGLKNAPTIGTMVGFLPQAKNNGVSARVFGNLGRPRTRPLASCDE